MFINGSDDMKNYEEIIAHWNDSDWAGWQQVEMIANDKRKNMLCDKYKYGDYKEIVKLCLNAYNTEKAIRDRIIAEGHECEWYDPYYNYFYYGSCSLPDLKVATKNHIFPVEVKCTKTYPKNIFYMRDHSSKIVLWYVFDDKMLYQYIDGHLMPLCAMEIPFLY